MKKEIADKWVAALRSGEYKQTTGQLANVERTEHCCLGVLCEMAIKDGVDVEVDVRPHDVYFDENSAGLPDKVQNWAGIFTANGVLNGGITIAALNDDEQYDFGRIANIIEESWREL